MAPPCRLIYSYGLLEAEWSCHLDILFPLELLPTCYDVLYQQTASFQGNREGEAAVVVGTSQGCKSSRLKVSCIDFFTSSSGPSMAKGVFKWSTLQEKTTAKTHTFHVDRR